MSYTPARQIERLTPAVTPITPEDSMAEAGRKILLKELLTLLQHEDGSRTGADIEDVHDMRVAIRRMRSAIRLLRPYLKWKAIRPYNRELRHLGRVLGEVRDLDVMIEQFQRYQTALDAESQAALQPTITALDAQRQQARVALNEYFNSKSYRRFVKSFAEFLLQPLPKPHLNGSVVPYQVRHVLPMLIYDRLSAVRAYDTVLDQADAPTLHALRIEFKRLRYLLSLFQAVLGPQVEDVIAEIKTIQDHLGHLNDGAVARLRLKHLLETDTSGMLAGYLAFLDTQELGLKDSFMVAWQRFNTRKVQQKLASAVLALA
ncbi:MAG: CHAD domain-containing protein [Chloroflexi bacterium]|nr:CHAD domain-containing protein [Chloroflexota bacterium]